MKRLNLIKIITIIGLLCSKNLYGADLIVTTLIETEENSFSNLVEKSQNGDIIIFNIPNTTSSIIYISKELIIDKDLTINGINTANQDTLTIFQNAEYTGVIKVRSSSKLSLSNLKITNGTYGIYIEKNGQLSMNHCTVFNNIQYGSEGGGIISKDNSKLIINNCLIANNASSNWGGIYSVGYVEIKNTVITKNSNTFNSAGITMEGGSLLIEDSKITQNVKGIYLWNTSMIMKRCFVDGNWHTGNAYGGGIDGRGRTDIYIEDSKFTNNIAGDGAGICSFGKLTLKNSEISNNRSTTNAGGIQFAGTDLVIENCVINNNTSYNYAGGINLQCISCGVKINNTSISNNKTTNGWGSSGGGLYAFAVGEFLMENSTINGNESVYGGGIAINSFNCNITLINNTIHQNYASKDGGAFYKDIGNFPRNIIFINNTFTGNIAKNIGGCINYASLEVNGEEKEKMILYNNIFAYNYSSLGVDDINYNNVNNIIINENLIIEGTNNILMTKEFENSYDNFTFIECDLLSPIFNEYKTTDGYIIPKLSNNGGITETVSLSSNSIAIGAGISYIDDIKIPIKDQRGFRRNTPPCIGAFEYGGINNIKSILNGNYPKIYSNNSSITISDVSENSHVLIVDLQGRVLFNAIIMENSPLIIPLQKGIFIVKIGDYKTKVLIK